MWKKSKHGLRRIIVISLLFLLVFLPLSAIPSWLTGSESALQINQLKNTIAEKEALIESMTLYIQDLEARLNELVETSMNSKTMNKELENFIDKLRLQLSDLQKSLQLRDLEMVNLRTAYSDLQIQLEELVGASTESNGSENVLRKLVEQLQTQLKSSNENLTLAMLEIESLRLNLSQLETLTGLSKESFQSLMGEYLPLKEAYDLKVAESAKYYQEAVNAKADADKRKFNGMASINGIYFGETGTFGVGVVGGFGFGEYMLTLGADYELKSPLVFNIGDLTYRAGLMVRF